MTPTPFAVGVAGRVTDAERQEIIAVDEAAAGADGVSPLDDQVRLDLQSADSRAVRHLICRVPPSHAIAGYGHVDLSSPEAASAHLVVHPDHRRRGIGTALVAALADESSTRALRVWAHGDAAAARLLASRLGFRRVRDLWQMRRSLLSSLDQPTYPADVVVRMFESARDESAWVALNAAAFADHPEQGQTTREGLRQRMAQPWFDPRGFFLADRAGELLGFHWTKAHEAGPGPKPPVGEVYVVGVHPRAQGLGLGRALTLTGLHHLRGLGLGEVLLYVESDNRAAVAVYQRLGFERAQVDVMYQRP